MLCSTFSPKEAAAKPCADSGVVFYQALALYQTAVELDPTNAMAWGMYGRCEWAVTKDLASSEAKLRRAIELDPNGLIERGNLAFVLNDALEKLQLSAEERRELEARMEESVLEVERVLRGHDTKETRNEMKRCIRRALELTEQALPLAIKPPARSMEELASD
eukprot:2358718-Rhodomonas_salina.1